MEPTLFFFFFLVLEILVILHVAQTYTIKTLKYIGVQNFLYYYI